MYYQPTLHVCEDLMCNLIRIKFQHVLGFDQTKPSKKFRLSKFSNALT